MKKKLFTYLTLAFAGLIACTEVEVPVYDNPYDPLNPNPLIPKAVISANTPNDMVINATEISITWTGKSSESKYAYKLDGVDADYTSWANNTSVHYTFLDEGSYSFHVKEQLESGVEQEVPSSINFKVDAITDCGLVLKKYHTITKANTNFSIDLNVEEVAKLNGVTTILNFNTSQLEFLGAQAIPNTELADEIGLLVNTPTEANASAKIEINVLLLGGNANGFSGNAGLCRLTFKAKNTDNKDISFTETATELRNTSNKKIPFTILRNAKIN